MDAASTQAMGGAVIRRTIQHRANVIAITYSVSSPITIRHVAYVVANAQPWCAR